MCDIGISFLAVIDWMVQGVTYRKREINWGRFQNLEDLDFAEDLALLSSFSNQIQRKTDELVKLAATPGLRASKPRTKVMRINLSTIYN